MIRKIYTTLFSFACAVLTLTSCSDWLNLNPQDEIKKEYLFSTGDGFRTALNGIYRKMSTFDMYGSNMTWGLMDAWAQYYHEDVCPDRLSGSAMEYISKLAFKNAELVPYTNAMWRASWNVVANCNQLIQETEKADPSIFGYLDWEKQMILGEAIGLRAFVQFDLLRIYAPSPASVGFKEDTRTFIPYVKEYPSYISTHQTVEYCLEQIIADLERAQAIMQEVDKESNMSGATRFLIEPSSSKQFLGSRGYRLNYYAITAELARVYLYAGKNKEALVEAQILLKARDEKGFFKASEYPNFTDGNMKMYEDIIFALYSPTELVDWDQEMNHANDGSRDEYYLAMDGEVVKNLYGNERYDDWRFQYQLEPKEEGFYYRTLKYNKQSESKDTGKRNNCMIPMIRMSEIFYIAAEAIYDTNPEGAYYYLWWVKYGRGVSLPGNPITDKTSLIELLLNDARREFIGEGQLFYMYKRLHHPIYPRSTGTENILPTDENMVLPKPDSESSI